MHGIIPDKSKKIVFEKVVMQAMENLVSEGEVSYCHKIIIHLLCTTVYTHIYVYILFRFEYMEMFLIKFTIIFSNI